ncbi:orotidine-5'-phosphate decarboxylase [Nesterenkonia muleiensis]|uniref:orotidine-5'-phosphate decarboxylase n=1 Tax=Nesterenkonia muleiensis TaxID=2282648 RepID=UPI000E71E76F|nr:orotidine-5'-phosphate decarboxylase [Nesterenkonia muleiensis]
MSFGERLAQVMDTYGHLCVGIDPHPEILRDWGLPEDGTGLKEFGQRIIEAAAGRVGVVKPQVAFFENYGVSGMQALAELIRSAKEAGMLVIADAKRGDIGSTMAAYASAWLNPEKDFAVDALTVSPYLGFGSLSPAVQAAHRYGAGLFVLALTSNPEGQQVQLAQGHPRTEERQSTVAGQIVEQVASSNVVYADQPLGSIGLVVGATTAHLAAEYGIDLAEGRPPILAPGYGAQGATAQQLRAGFGAAWEQVLVSSSRGILAAGPQQADLVSAIESSRAELS